MPKPTPYIKPFAKSGIVTKRLMIKLADITNSPMGNKKRMGIIGFIVFNCLL